MRYDYFSEQHYKRKGQDLRRNIRNSVLSLGAFLGIVGIVESFVIGDDVLRYLEAEKSINGAEMQYYSSLIGNEFSKDAQYFFTLPGRFVTYGYYGAREGLEKLIK